MQTNMIPLISKQGLKKNIIDILIDRHMTIQPFAWSELPLKIFRHNWFRLPSQLRYGTVNATVYLINML